MNSESTGELAISRRSFLQGSLTLAAAGSAVNTAGGGGRKPHVVVVGAGALGGWSAYEMLRRGAQVTLVDAWGPGNGRSSSGGESRVIRSVYGGSEVFTDLALRSLDLWREAEERFGQTLYQRTGLIVLGAYELILESLPLLKSRGIEVREFTAQQAKTRYPQINFDGIERVFEEDDAGFLHAREACRVVAEHFAAEGGEHRAASARPGKIEGGRLEELVLGDGTRLKADLFLFACGPWMPRLFPEILEDKITVTRQEVHYFGIPAGDERFSVGRLPVWIDWTSDGYYGIPTDRGFKIANHHHGEAFDPTSGDRVPQAEQIEKARRFLAQRFPALADAPLVEARICQYSNTSDESFLFDRHPEADNLWLLGGGSGHAFKHGPAMGEHVAGCLLQGEAPEPSFSLAGGLAQSS